MSDELQEMLDHFKIRQVLERYCRGVDRNDAELLNSVYWPDAQDDHGVYKGLGQAFAAWLFPVLRETYVATMHAITQSNIKVKGNQGAADTYFLAYHRIENAEGITLDAAYGRYVDRFEKRGGEWRLMDRTVVMEHMQVEHNVATGALTPADFVRGARDKSDLSYRMYEGL